MVKKYTEPKRNKSLEFFTFGEIVKMIYLSTSQQHCYLVTDYTLFPEGTMNVYDKHNMEFFREGMYGSSH